MNCPEPLLALGLALLATSTCGPMSASAQPIADPLGASTDVGCVRTHAPDPDPDLYCIELVPIPDLLSAGGTVRLIPPQTPFGVAVTADGVNRTRVAVEARDLPPPESLGYTRYVAWATTPFLRPIVRLGELREGRVEGEIAMDRFMVIVSAEGDSIGDAWTGRIVLRGMSAANRVLPLDDPLMLMGALSPPEPPADMHAGHTPTDGEWPLPPMEPDEAMAPGMMTLRPDVNPYRPPGGPHPAAVPTSAVRLLSGDTLRLVAGTAERQIEDRTITAFAFNGQYPGPSIRVERDAEIVVEFENRLNLPSAIHWHGLRLENRSDGVPQVTQEGVQPGEVFRYTLRFPDAGLYWYHAHHREDIQQELGLYGTILVEDPEVPGNPVDAEIVLVLDDILLAEGGVLPSGAEAATHALTGRFGNSLLINGEPDYRLELEAPSTIRFLFANASNTRIFNLSFDAGAKMKVVSSDLGPFQRAELTDNVVIAPGERYGIEVRFPERGTYSLMNRVRALDRTAGRFLQRVDTIGTVRVRSGSAVADRAETADFGRPGARPGAVAELERLQMHLDRPVDRTLHLSMEVGELPFSMMAMMRADSAFFQPVEWSGTMEMMNWAATGRQVRWILRDGDTGAENEGIDWRFELGDVVKIRVVNDREVLHAMHHPIHLHGQRFLVVARNGEPVRNLVWKDTFILPVGQTADILIELSNPGAWMLHCHIAEHLESGMRMVVHVDPAAGPSATEPVPTLHRSH